MEKNKSTQGLTSYLISIAMFFVTILGVGFASFFFGQESAAIIRNTVASGISVGAVLLLRAQAKEKKTYDYDNIDYYGRFFLCYAFGLLTAVVCGKLPAGGWPFVPLFVLLALFSNSLIGICTGSTLLIIAMMLSGAGVGIFLLYFVSGMVAVCLFHGLDENYKVGIPTVVTLIVFVVNITAEIILFENAKLNLEMFIIPILNVILTCILLIVILKIFSYLVIYKYRDRYMEINDPECPLLVQLKDKSKEEYYKAVHTAYLSDKIARKLELDDKVAKAGGYYHRIGFLKGENSCESVLEIGKEYRFPPEVLDVLEEYLKSGNRIIHKEAAVIYFAEAVVSSILFLMANDREAKLDYDKIIDTVFEKKQESDIFKDCQLSIGELNRMKKMFKEEKLYYDFLR